MNKTINQLYDENNVSSLVRDILNSQDLTYSQVEQILKDKKYPLSSESLDNIINRLYKAKALEEKVVIVGDYDADGIMATTILYTAFKRFGLDVGFYIPNRLSEGYGINENIVENVESKGYTLIITVDNGVVAYEALNKAKELNVEVIVTDHHHIDEAAQYAYDYLLHPKYLPEGYNDLCGAGLALIIAEKLLNKQNVGNLYVYAMVATIADMVSVFGFNRNIIKNGLFYLNKFGDKHIENLIHYRNGVIDQQVISFQVVPKLNTFGRLADKVNVNNMVRYFLLEDLSEIETVSKEITSLNQMRIDLTRDSFDNNKELIKYGSLNILIGDFHEGITGLIAGRHLNAINEPILVLTKVDGIYKGSGRSPKGYNIHKLLDPLSSNFLSFGGHSQACGISFKEQNLDNIFRLISEKSKDLSVEAFEQAYLELDTNALSVETVEEFKKLEPYGVDFIKPKLKVSIDVAKKPQILKEKYLKWSLDNNLEMLCFNANLNIDEYLLKKDLTAFVELSLNTFRNKTSVNMIVSEFIED